MAPRPFLSKIMIVFVPVFEKDGNRFIVRHEGFVADSEDGAWAIAIGAIPESVIYKFDFTKEVLEIDTDNFLHVPMRLGELPIAVLSGPILNEIDDD